MARRRRTRRARTLPRLLRERAGVVDFLEYLQDEHGLLPSAWARGMRRHYTDRLIRLDADLDRIRRSSHD